MLVRAVGGGSEYDIYRAESHAPAVMAALRAYDPQILVGWDSAACRWSLLRVSRGGYHFLGVLQRPNGDYRQLDMTILEDLARRDMHATSKSGDERAIQQFEQQEARDQKAWDDFDQDIHHATLDNRRTLQRIHKLAGF